MPTDKERLDFLSRRGRVGQTNLGEYWCSLAVEPWPQGAGKTLREAVDSAMRAEARRKNK